MVRTLGRLHEDQSRSVIHRGGKSGVPRPGVRPEAQVLIPWRRPPGAGGPPRRRGPQFDRERGWPIVRLTLTVIWNGLVSIAEEMGSILRRTAFSEAVREGDDFSTGLFDAEARLVAQGNFTPGHLGSMPHVIRSVLEYFPRETLKPGDAVLLNDSFLGSGHFPDCVLRARH